jgi:hypothetical protein
MAQFILKKREVEYEKTDISFCDAGAFVTGRWL